MFYSLKLLPKAANCNAQGKVEREEYISIIFAFIFVNEHDSVANAFLKIGVFSFFLASFFFFFLLRQKIIKLAAQGKERMAKCISAGTDFGSDFTK